MPWAAQITSAGAGTAAHRRAVSATELPISTDRANSDLSIRFANFNREFTI
jgi:hypothetical protein